MKGSSRAIRRRALVATSAALLVAVAMSASEAGAAVAARCPRIHGEPGRVADRSPSKGIHVVGNALFNAAGRRVILHGVDRSGPEYACIQGWGIFDNGGSGPEDNSTDDDSQPPIIRSWGANEEQIGLNEDCWLGINGVKVAYGGKRYRAAIEHYVKTIEHAHMYPIISLFWEAPGTQKATGQSSMPDADHAPLFWHSVAEAFRKDPNVIFRLKEEPFPDGNTGTQEAWSCWKNGDVQYGEHSGLKPTSRAVHCHEGYPTVGMQSLINIIRGTGATNVIQVPGVEYDNDMAGFLSSRYRVHDDLAHPQLMGVVDVYPDFNTCGTVSCYDAEYRPVIRVMPFMAGETGVDGSLSGCPTRKVDTFLDWMDKEKSGYSAWVWDAWGGCGVLITNYHGGVDRPWGRDYRRRLGRLERAGRSLPLAMDMTTAPSVLWESSPRGHEFARGPSQG